MARHFWGHDASLYVDQVTKSTKKFDMLDTLAHWFRTFASSAVFQGTISASQ
jgi:hypothetical protein